MDPQMDDILKFRKMITPIIIQVLFWIGVVVVVINGFSAMRYDFFTGLMLIILGPIAVRLYAEILIVIFKLKDGLDEVNQTLTEIKNQRGQTGM